MKIAKVSFIFFFCWTFFSCSSKSLSENSDREKNINGLLLKLHYISPKTLAQRENANDNSINMDSLEKYYSRSLQFVLSIVPEDEKGDVMTSSVKNYNEYAELSHEMNFEMEKMVYLTIGDKIYYPVLSAMENIYGMKAGRDIIFSFVPASLQDSTFYQSDSLCFTYEDQLFNLGINHFTYSRKELNIN